MPMFNIAVGASRVASLSIRSQATSEAVDHARVLIERHVLHMNRHIEDLLGTGPQPAGKANTLQCSHLDLRTIVKHAVSSIAPDMAQRAHHLVVRLPSDAIWVHVDASRLEQAFCNLLINAAKYTPNGGEIEVTLERLTTHARLRIRDSGIGIEAAMLLRVFDMYAQADTAAKCAEAGSGIGLTLARDLVEKHGGTVQASSAGLGFGSEFTVMVPVLWATGPTQSTTSFTS
jgi:two-component system CheB/CheR fusion protein